MKVPDVALHTALASSAYCIFLSAGDSGRNVAHACGIRPVITFAFLVI
jgi:hypothetical protein